MCQEAGSTSFGGVNRPQTAYCHFCDNPVATRTYTPLVGFRSPLGCAKIHSTPRIQEHPGDRLAKIWRNRLELLSRQSLTGETNDALLVEEVSRYFGRDRFPAVEDVSFSVASGEIHGLLGPNGAGKTTTVRMCSTLLVPSAGHISVNGVDAVRRPLEARKQLSLVLGGDLGFYPRVSARANLLFFADVAAVPRKSRKSEVDRALEQVQLTSSAATKVGALSRGMKQRLHIARALLGSPKLVLLDEPTTGLDPEVALSMRQLIRDIASRGAGVLLTSHSMVEIEELSSKVSVIGRGKIAVQGSVADVVSASGVLATTTATADPQDAAMLEVFETASRQVGTVAIRPKGFQLSVSVYWSVSPERASSLLVQAAAEAGRNLPADTFTRPASLEDAYLALAEGLRR